MQYVCAKKCFYTNRLFAEGEKIDFKEGAYVPRHFSLIEEQDVKTSIKPEVLIEEEKTIETLRTTLDGMGKAYDRRWGIAKLEHEIQQAKKGM